MTGRGHLRVSVLVAVIAVLAAVTSSEAQRRRGFGFGQSLRIASPESFDEGFHFCRVAFRGNRYGDGGGWSVDYPRADINLSIRLSELTKTRVSFASAGEPETLVTELTNEALFYCPFVMMTEVGAAFLDDNEAAALRNYLLKGGFLWADDFWGSYAWEAWTNEFSKVLAPSQYAVRDIPLDHPMFRSMFVLPKVPQIPSINHWAGTGTTSERAATAPCRTHAASSIRAIG